MTVYEMAKHYYLDYNPPLWDKHRLKRLVAADKLEIKEYEEITGEEYSLFGN